MCPFESYTNQPKCDQFPESKQAEDSMCGRLFVCRSGSVLWLRCGQYGLFPAVVNVPMSTQWQKLSRDF
ncbi:hypothetical protein Y032_0599g476 [Ancylostoma ceylanicum]|uniref:Uncharacterized protein n=1 Tax=Ancylostoma ceylanicum TaxID=53326 RepID=A0A016WNA5_9BILA|nr:hypothetical protein Y032_0599g476 [Ancylostoma ceylanicum]